MTVGGRRCGLGSGGGAVGGRWPREGIRRGGVGEAGTSRIAVRFTTWRGASSSGSSTTGTGRMSTTTEPARRSCQPRRQPLGSTIAVQASAAAPKPIVGRVATPRTKVRSSASRTPIGRASSAESTRSPTAALPGVTPHSPASSELSSPTSSTVPAITATPAHRLPGSIRHVYAAHAAPAYTPQASSRSSTKA